MPATVTQTLPLTGYEATASCPVGTEFTDGLGNTYMYVQFKDAVTYAANQVLTWRSRSSVTVTNDISNSLISYLMAGLALAAVPENYYGWMQTGGYNAAVKKDPNEDTWAAGDAVTPDASVDGVASVLAYAGSLAGFKTVIGCGAVAVAASVDGSTDTVACHVFCRR